MILGLVAAVSLALPSVDVPQLPPITRDPQITYVDRTGQVIGVRGGRYAPPVDVAKLPKYVPAAFVAIEDRRFYEHSGFDVQGIARAIVTDIGRGKAAEGASTITQQLAKNLFLTSDRNLERKGIELVYAVELEQAYSKDQILGLYLSRVYFGSGAYGIDEAARRYFGVTPAHLTLREAAMLAALMKSPTDYNPIEHPDASAERAKLVLDAMVETGAITDAQRTKALATTPRVYKSAADAPSQYFVDWVDAQFRAMGPPKLDIVVQTTLDAHDEAAADAAAKATLERFAHAEVEQAALVSLDGAGRVRAMVGGADYAKSSFNRAVDAHRQAGSSWKPFVYLTALYAGRSPQSTMVDGPDVVIDGWSPKDFEPTYMGTITLETALAQSVNTVAAQLADQVGRPNVAATARRLGIGTAISTDPAMALGASLVTPLEMAGAYDAFANGGNGVQPYAIEKAWVLASGRQLWAHPARPPVNVIANPPLGELDEMLRQVVARGTGTKAAIAGFDIAGKTGTTSDYKDAWFCGFTGGFTTVVWMGKDDNSGMRGVTGGSAPAELWRAYMKSALHGQRPVPIPAGPAPTLPPPVVTQPPPTPEATNAAAPT